MECAVTFSGVCSHTKDNMLPSLPGVTILQLFFNFADLRPSMGDPKSGFIVTMHCVVRPAGTGKPAGTGVRESSSHFLSPSAFFLRCHAFPVLLSCRLITFQLSCFMLLQQNPKTKTAPLGVCVQFNDAVWARFLACYISLVVAWTCTCCSESFDCYKVWASSHAGPYNQRNQGSGVQTGCHN